MAFTEGVAEFFDRVARVKGRDAKIKTLREGYTHPAIVERMLDLCFNPNVKWLLPDTEFPEGELKLSAKENDLQGVLPGNIRKMDIFHSAGGYNGLKPVKREQVYQQFLESMDPDDARMIDYMRVHRKLANNGLTKKLIAEAYPKLGERWTENNG